jgi:hypothetical protein
MEVSVEIPGWVKKALKIWIAAAVIGHSLEAPFAYSAAKKRGENPRRYLVGTLALGAIVLIPLLRKPKLEKEAEAVDI